jgi:hypothetical protein
VTRSAFAAFPQSPYPAPSTDRAPATVGERNAA